MIRFTPRPLPLFLSLLTVTSLPVFAQDEVTLDSVVVTASGFEQQIKEAPASISVITREQLEAKPYMNLEDAVRQVEGVSITGSDPNDKDISIRGMTGEYTLILVDGKRQGTRETMNRGTGGVQSSLIPPLAAIERVEVIRGPMSSLYGSDAMGGVINIITRKVGKQWQGSVSVGGTLQGDSAYGNTAQGDFWLSGPLKEGVVGLQVFGHYSDRAEDEIFYPSNLTQGAYGERNRNLGAKLTIVPNEQQDVVLEVGRNDLTNKSTAGKTNADEVVETTHSRDSWGITHNGRWGFGISKLALYQEVGKLESWEDGKKKASEPKIVNTVLDALITLPFDQHVLKTGAQINHGRLSSIANESPVAGHGVSPDEASARTWALFLEDEYALTSKLSLTGGIRMDDADRYGSHWSPRLYAVYQINDAWTVRGGVASAFKAPALRQTTPGYCMQSGGGTSLRGSLCGNPNLKPEESVTEEIGVRYDGTKGESFSMTVFNNDFKNKVVSFDTGKKDPSNPKLNTYIYDNLDQVVMRGVELAASWPLSRELSLSGNYTYTQSRREGGTERSFSGGSLDGAPLGKTPEHLANAQLNWKPLEKLSAYTHATYTGKETWAAFRNGAVGPRERPSTLTFDVGGRYEINKTFALSLAVMNLTDKIVPVDTRARLEGLDGNWMVDEGRRYWMKLEANF
ncbi:MAG: hypothetical protein RL571_164 [Pseudomonadota bacterium]